MRITYDPEADAAYFYMAVKTDFPDTRQLTEDIYVDFDAQERLVGIEVLDASKRLDLQYLLPDMEVIGREEPGWHKLKIQLLRCKQSGIPVKMKDRGTKSWVEDVETSYVSLRRDPAGNIVTITRDDLDNKDHQWHKSHRRLAVVKALWNLGSYE